MEVESDERRRVQRVRLLKPLAGRAGGKRIFILEVSREGLRVAHQHALGRSGDRWNIEFEWDGEPVHLDCELTNTQVVQRVGKASYAQSIHHSGFNIVECSVESDKTIRDLIIWHVARALDEQKANARGIPAVAAQSVQTGKASTFIRHQYVAGRWRETQTADPTQPAHGFTISDQQTDEEVAMLRTAYEAGDSAARTTIQRMAELSVSRAEGVPTRRYQP